MLKRRTKKRLFRLFVLPFVEALRRRERKRAIRYFDRLGLRKSVEQQIAGDHVPMEKLGDKVTDLARLHRQVRRQKPAIILEFGSGLSTVIMAQALKRLGNGQIHYLEGSREWSDLVEAAIPGNLKAFVTPHVSTPQTTLVGNQLCLMFDKRPDVSPDLIYLDGPDPEHQAVGEVNGLTFSERPPVAADILHYESTLPGGCEIIIDGRVNNYYFLLNNLKRRWKVRRDLIHRAHRMMLKDWMDMPTS